VPGFANPLLDWRARADRVEPDHAPVRLSPVQTFTRSQTVCREDNTGLSVGPADANAVHPGIECTCDWLATPLSFSAIRSCNMNAFTTVELMWVEKRIENRIRFGHPVREQIIDRHRRVLSFAPGSVFAFVRWTSNDFGTVLSRVDILRAAEPGRRYSTVPWISPGGESLLRLSGWPKVERVLHLIDAVEALGIDPADAAPDYWHHVHNRLSVNETPRGYTRARHQAWQHRRRVGS
jgi:hypothetical protein